MSSTTHTPGPWSADPFTGAVVARNPVRKMVAMVYGDDPECAMDARMRANSRLMAASPDLLEALKFAVVALERSDYIQMDGESFDVVDVARAAIAKATNGAA